MRILTSQAVGANMIVTPKIYTDDGSSSTTLSIINNTNYSGEKNIIIRPNNLTGKNNFWLELKWTGSALCTVNLPIEIDFEVIED